MGDLGVRNIIVFGGHSTPETLVSVMLLCILL